MITVQTRTLGRSRPGVPDPAGGLFIALFFGWKMTAEATREELMLADGFVYRTWHTLPRYLIPPVVLLIMVANF